jgi:methylated-DNA-[protein]-cysteine S-methyltransferase
MTQLAVCKNVRAGAGSTNPMECEVAATAFVTELGWMALACRGELVAGLVFGHATRRQAAEALRRNLARRAADSPIDVWEVDELPASIRGVVARLEDYAAGEAVDFSVVRIDQRHLTAFGRRVTNACRRIPRGKTRSYGELASVCGAPGAARAVGQVMATNRYPLIVPCHRVLAAGGLLGGFSAPQGLAMKRRLLEMEGRR